ncbi:MAG: thermonuclease family protein [Corallococcus sp.]|nr:thermonuclease family protein [Corallococcus sp.]
MKKRQLVGIILAFMLLCCTLAACGGVADNTEHFDSITKTLKLNKDFTGKSFWTQGGGYASVASYTDGDTTRFRLQKDNSEVNIRYYEIDTPEATSKIEKWGKSASYFVKQRLSEATEIVLEATKTPAEKDTYNSRYLGYVWYKTAEYNEFKCLNLEMVENGFSQYTASNTSAHPYYEYFKRANDFAQSVQLRLYSELDDPFYFKDAVDVSLKEFWQNPTNYYNKEVDVGYKIKFEACLTDIYTYNGDNGVTYTFTAVNYDPVTGEKYTIDIFAGYTGNSAINMELGHLYELIGNVAWHNDRYQITNVTPPNDYYPDKKGFSKILQYNYYLTFSTSVGYADQYFSTLYTDVTVVSSSVEGSTLTIVGTANKRNKNGIGQDAVTFTFVTEVPQTFATNPFTAGTKFSVSGYQFETNSRTISVVDYSDITIIK